MQELSASETEKITAVDFSHILLFFTTIFFVVHAVYLIFRSVTFLQKYRQYSLENLEDLIYQVRLAFTTDLYPTQKFLLQNPFVSLSSLQFRVEYKILHLLFDSHYYVPTDFDFASYLSGCFADFTLSIINRSLVSWVVLSILIVVNYARIKAGFKCDYATPITESEVHFGDLVHGQDRVCSIYFIRYFYLGGMCILLYTITLMVVSRVYKLRLLALSGVSNYEEFFEYLDKHATEIEETYYGISYRYESSQLKNLLVNAIEKLDDEEDERGHKTAAMFLTGLHQDFMAMYKYGVGALRSFCMRCNMCGSYRDRHESGAATTTMSTEKAAYHRSASRTASVRQFETKPHLFQREKSVSNEPTAAEINKYLENIVSVGHAVNDLFLSHLLGDDDDANAVCDISPSVQLSRQESLTRSLHRLGIVDEAKGEKVCKGTFKMKNIQYFCAMNRPSNQMLGTIPLANFDLVGYQIYKSLKQSKASPGDQSTARDKHSILTDAVKRVIAKNSLNNFNKIYLFGSPQMYYQ